MSTSAKDQLTELLQEQAGLVNELAAAAHGDDLGRLTVLQQRQADLPGEIRVATVAALREKLATLEAHLPEIAGQRSEATAQERVAFGELKKAQKAHREAQLRCSRLMSNLRETTQGIGQVRLELDDALEQLATGGQRRAPGGYAGLRR